MSLNEILNACKLENKLLLCLGAQAQAGGEWDVRTRFVTLVRSTEFGRKLMYNFNLSVDPKHGKLALDFIAQDFNLLHTTAVLAACAFGASDAIQTVVISSRKKCFFGGTVTSFAFERHAFIANFNQYFAEANPADNNVATSLEALRILQPTQESLNLKEDGTLGITQRIKMEFETKHLKLNEDTRELPAILKFLLCADTVDELDYTTLSQDEKERLVYIFKLMQGAKETPVYCIAELEGMLNEYDVVEAALEKQRAYDDAADDWSEVRTFKPLYCKDQCERALITHYDLDPTNRYLRVPRSAYLVRLNLARLYRQINDPSRALSAAQACIALGPTSVDGYFEAIHALFELGRYQEATGRALQALAIALHPDDIDRLYYLLGCSYEQEKRYDLALAAFAMIDSSTKLAKKIQTQVKLLGFMVEDGAHMDLEQARQLLSNYNVPLAPRSEVIMTLSKVAIMLVDKGMFKAAAPLVQYLGRYTKDKVLLQVAVSLKFELKHERPKPAGASTPAH